MTMTAQDITSRKKNLARETKAWYVEQFMDYTTLAEFLNADPPNKAGEFEVATVAPDGSIIAFVYL